MMNIAKKYVTEIRDETNYSPTWLPQLTVAVGDICRLENFRYERVSDLASKGIAFQVDTSSPADITYASSGVQSFDAGVSGGTSTAITTIGEVSASARISFQNAGGVVFEATGCRSTRIRDLDGIGKKVLSLHAVGEWDPDYVLVTEVVAADSATILISSEDNASVEVSAAGNAVPALGNLAKLAGNLKLGNEHNIGVKLIGSSLTPLFRAAGVKRRLFGNDQFRSMESMAPMEESFGRVDYEDFADGD